MTTLEFLAISLAAAAIVDAWRKGSIFAGPRAAVADIAANSPDAPAYYRLLDCWYCLSYWVPALLIAPLVLPGLIWPPLKPYLMLPAYGLAATRLLVLVNGLVPERMRHEYEAASDGPPVDVRALIGVSLTGNTVVRRNGTLVALVDASLASGHTDDAVCKNYDITPEELEACRKR